MVFSFTIRVVGEGINEEEAWLDCKEELQRKVDKNVYDDSFCISDRQGDGLSGILGYPIGS